MNYAQTRWITQFSLVLPETALAQSYPAMPIAIYAPCPVGGTVDVVARVLADRLWETLGEPILIDNCTRAAGSIGTGLVARAPADG